MCKNFPVTLGSIVANMSVNLWAAVSAPLCLAVLFDFYLILHVILFLFGRNKMNE